jgi:hypothetical protein
MSTQPQHPLRKPRSQTPQGRKTAPRDFSGMAGRHEAENLASSFTGLVAFVAKGAKHYAQMSRDPQYTPKQQALFRKTSQQYRRVANDTMQSIEECIGRPLFQGPYVAERFNRPERAQMLTDFERLPAKATQSLVRDLAATDAMLNAQPDMVQVQVAAFQPASASLQSSDGPVTSSGLMARLGGLLSGRRS